MSVKNAKWFKQLRARTKVIAKLKGVVYPNDDPGVNRDLHAEAEWMMGKSFKKQVAKEMGW